LARGLGYEKPVTSPTFALSQIYRLKPPLELHHYDLYRLADSGAVGDELDEDLSDPHVITIIEWAGIVEADLPADHLRIEFAVTSDTGRTLKSGGPNSQRLIKALIS
jgi:tRNA threonylcarbamoyladenosine biosynthesis protein TsaE